jgi:hypothetical protein
MSILNNFAGCEKGRRTQRDREERGRDRRMKTLVVEASITVDRAWRKKLQSGESPPQNSTRKRNTCAPRTIAGDFAVDELARERSGSGNASRNEKMTRGRTFVVCFSAKRGQRGGQIAGFLSATTPCRRRRWWGRTNQRTARRRRRRRRRERGHVQKEDEKSFKICLKMKLIFLYLFFINKKSTTRPPPTSLFLK